MKKRSLGVSLVLALMVPFASGWLAACGDDDKVSSDKEAEQAYLGLDGIVETGIDLGFAGMNAASGANIPAQMAMGKKAGTLTVTGKVDQGSSDNKNMDLALGLVGFANLDGVTYDTPADAAMQPKLTLSLKKLPTGTLNGTLIGDFMMKGDLEGVVTLNVTIAGMMEPDPMDATKVRRKAGTTTIKGTATSKAGTYQVDLTR